MKSKVVFQASLLIAAVYIWLGCGMIILRSPIITMLFYYSFCFIGGAILAEKLIREKIEDTIRVRMNPALVTLLFCALSTGVIWAFSLLFRPDIIDPEIISRGLASIDMTAERYLITAGLLIIVNPFAEEFFWRFVILRLFIRSMEKFHAIVLANVLFCGYHPLIVSMIFPPPWLAAVVLVTFIGGLALSWLFLISNKLRYPVILHLIMNLNLMIMGFRYSSATP